MINAWSLLYEELNGTMDETYPIMSKDDDVTILGGDGDDSISFTGSGMVGAADTVPWDYNDGYVSFGSSGYTGVEGTDTLNFGTPIPGGMGEDHISFNVNPGLANTAYDDPKYYARDFGDDPYPSVGSVYFPDTSDTMSPVQDDIDQVYKFHLETTKPQPDLTSEATQKYGEDKGIKDLKDYVSSTYSGHYTSKNNNVQTLDLIQSVGDAESFCRSNAIKYLSRYDKKGQAKRDILKAMHYCLLLYYFSGNANDETPTRGYETF